MQYIDEEHISGADQEREISAKLERKESLTRITQQTWKKRVTIEQILKADEQSQPDLMNAPHVAALFSDVFQLQKLITSLQGLPLEARQIYLEQFLWNEALGQDPLLASAKVGDLPFDLFSVPDSEENEAQIAFSSYHRVKDMPYGSIVATENTTRELLVPMTESIIQAVRDGITAECGIAILSDLQYAERYYKSWIEKAKKSEHRIVFSPMYDMYRQAILAHERRNGKNRTIARSLAYGPPGRGKTEFYRAINEANNNKRTLVISGRPHLSYEELVATPQIIGRDTIGNFSDLATLYNGLPAESVLRNIVSLADSYAQQMLAKELSGNDTQETNESHLPVFRSHWLRTMGFIDEEVIKNISKLSPQTITTISTTSDPLLFQKMETIKRSFVEQCALLAGKKAFVENSEEATQYLHGLIITADQLGMNVIIDEAEKMITAPGGQNVNESFGGLEYFFNLEPGSEFVLGNIKHRFSQDFFIDLSMNKRTIPPHIKSRFGERAFLFEETAYDRALIAAVGLSNSNGEVQLSPDAQEKLLFLLTHAWQSIEATAQKAEVPWDLRTLQSIISELVHNGTSRNISVATALSKFTREPAIAKIVAQFIGLLPQLDIARFFQNASPFPIESLEKNHSSPLLSTLSRGETGVQYLSKMHAQALSQSQIEALAKTAQPSGKNENLLRCMGADVTAVPSTKGTNLVFTLPDSEMMMRSIQVEIPNATLVSASLSGERIVVRDASGAFQVVHTHEDKVHPTKLGVDETSTVLVSPLGDALFTVLADGRLLMDSLPLSDKPHPVDLSVGLDIAKINKIEFSNDGNYLIATGLKRQDESGGNTTISMVLDARKTISTGISHSLLSTVLPGSGWRIASFENTLFVFNTQTSQGFRIS